MDGSLLWCKFHHGNQIRKLASRFTLIAISRAKCAIHPFIQGCMALFLLILYFNLNELFSDTIRLNTSASSFESLASTQKKPLRTNWKLS